MFLCAHLFHEPSHSRSSPLSVTQLWQRSIYCHHNKASVSNLHTQCANPRNGRGSAQFGQGVPYRGAIAELDHWYVNAGVFPHLEVGGRIVTDTYDCNGYFESGCGIRDLSATTKFQLPYLEEWTGFNLAFGAQDIGGAASNFDAYFVVADTEIDAFNLRLSGGYGKSDLSLGVLDGPFAGAEWQPFDFVQLTGEYDAQEFNAAVRLITPQDMLPYGAQLALSINSILVMRIKTKPYGV